MAGATNPGPVDDLGPPIIIDAGTLARTELQHRFPVLGKNKGVKS